MNCCSAAGRILPTFLIFNASLPTMSLRDSLPKTWGYAKSDQGNFMLHFLLLEEFRRMYQQLVLYFFQDT
jgi:hypothetical protein